MADALVAVPDDFPSVFEGSAAHERARKLGEVHVVTARFEIYKRIDGAWSTRQFRLGVGVVLMVKYWD